MKTIKNIILFCFLSCFVFLAYAKQEKVIQIFRNGGIIQEYPASEIDYIEVNDLILPPNEINATIQNNQIVIEWESVEDATYNVYRSRDNATYILVAYNLTETRYTDTDPFPDTNYYRITAVIDGNESNESETVTVVTPTIELPSGVYLGIYGFSRGFQIQPIQNITDENISHYNTFIDGLSATQAFTWLYYAVDKSIDYLQSTSFPEDLSEVAIVTFTDGQDVGSLDKIDEEENGKYLTPTQYRQALHSRLISEEVSNINISAFTIGVLEGKQGASLNTFRNNMNSLATSTSNVYEVEKMESLNQAFEQIANSLSETKYVQKFILSISGLGEGDLCRFTFDNVNSYQNSKLYIEGTYRRRDKALTNIKYVGLTSTSGSEVVGVFDDESGKYNYTFEGLKADDGSLIPTTKVQHWFTDDGTWQDVDDEFFFNPDDATLEKIKRSAAIMLNLDCSSSMQGQKLITLQEAAKKFIQILVDNTVDPYEVSEVQLDKSNLILQIGETATLKATVLPTTAKLKSVTWTSSNPAVASVDGEGNIIAKSLGNSIITVTTNDGGFTADCEICVIPTPIPQELSSNVKFEGIIISWEKVKMANYTVYRSSTNNGYEIIAENISENQFLDVNPLEGNNYYRVSATANNITSDLSQPIVVNYVPYPIITNIERMDGKITLSWSQIENATYSVYRSSDSSDLSESFQVIATNITANNYTDLNPLSNENYYFVKAKINDAESVYSRPAYQNYPFINGYEYVDLGLPSKLKWAKLNIGANSFVEAGNYYAYGEKSTKTNYSPSNYNTNASYYDAASSIWGGTWRIPDLIEFQELIDNCKWEWTTMEGVDGYLVEGLNGNTIFFPLTGLYYESQIQSNEMGCYWTRSRWDEQRAWRFNFNNSIYQLAQNFKFAGLSVRPVSE